MDRRIERTKASIEKAFFEILAEKGNKVTVSEIARIANIDRKTFYLHYESVDDIIKEFCERKVKESMDEIETKGDNKTFDIVALFDVLNQVISRNIELLQIIRESDNKYYFFELLKRNLVRSVTVDYRRYFVFNDLELSVYAEFYISGIIATYDRWLENKLPVSANDLATMISNAASRGLDKLIKDKMDCKIN